MRTVGWWCPGASRVVGALETHTWVGRAQVLGEALKSIGKSLEDGEIDYDEFSKVAMASHSAASKKE